MKHWKKSSLFFKEEEFVLNIFSFFKVLWICNCLSQRANRRSLVRLIYQYCTLVATLSRKHQFFPRHSSSTRGATSFGSRWSARDVFAHSIISNGGVLARSDQSFILYLDGVSMYIYILLSIAPGRPALLAESGFRQSRTTHCRILAERVCRVCQKLSRYHALCAHIRRNVRLEFVR